MKITKKKSLGQNFLKDDSVLDKIVLAGELAPEDNVLEIGPGEGALTKKLVEKAGQVVAIEKDSRLKDKNSSLQKVQRSCGKSDLRQNKIKLYFEDILEVNLSEILKENNFDKNGYKVIANIPYYITGKIIRLLFQQNPLSKVIVLLVQKEVADRIEAKNGRHSILSLSVQYYASAEIVDYVPREAFDPMPNVDSAILKITPFEQSDVGKEMEKQFFKLVKIGFSSPRKRLFKNLKNGLKIEKTYLEKIFDNLKFDLNARAENLTVADWQNLQKELKK